ncbi:MAG: NAD(+)/NADH kinase [Oscillospiraceae bacterium]|nr:NAD(+)/NADH kinase [Oscillospiraceae bacterium]
MIALCPNPYRDTDLSFTKNVALLLGQAGFEAAVCPVFSDDEPDVIPKDVKACKITDVVDACTLAVVIGGDGTMLAVARQLHGRDLPMLGVNLGTKGFMTALEPENIALIVEAARGHYTISKRMMLDIALVRAGEVIYSDSVLNDAVIHGYGECVTITAWCNGQRMTGFTGDGVILSTPTGSTGYTMSAGGPIVEPDTENIILSPICAHVMGSRTFVLDPGREILIRMEKSHGRRAYLSADGNSVIDLENGDFLRVRRSEHHALMVDMGLKSFYEIAYEKLR